MHMSTHVFACACVCARACVCVRAYVHACVVRACVSMYKGVRVFICTYLDVEMCMFVHTLAHTLAHTHIWGGLD